MPAHGPTEPTSASHGRSRRPRQIVALGGGGFSEEPGGAALDDCVLDASGAGLHGICFLPTAAGDNSSYVVKFYAAFRGRSLRPRPSQPLRPDGRRRRSVLLAQDVIYVGGGHTANLLAVWRAHGVDVVLREAWERGIVLAGLCAGSMCWFESGITASLGTRMTPLDGGLASCRGATAPTTPGAVTPTCRRMRGGMAGGVSAEDEVALHFVDRRLAAVVASREGPRAYRVGMAGDRAIEAPLRPVILDPPGRCPRGSGLRPKGSHRGASRARRRAVAAASGGDTDV